MSPSVPGMFLDIPTVRAIDMASLTAAQMAAVDRAAIDEYGVTLLQMMEQAGSHLAEVVRIELGGDLRGQRVVVAAGPGNNGGGGLVAARHLANRGAFIQVVLARPALQMSDAAQHQLATLVSTGAECCVATYDLGDEELERDLGRANAIVDAVLGYRIDGAPRGEEERLIGFVERSGRAVISLDLPSGVDPDTGHASGAAITAVATMTLALPKTGLLSSAGAARTGRLYLADLGLPAALFEGLGITIGHPFAAGRILRVTGDR